jgi:type III restriction enzyme
VLVCCPNLTVKERLQVLRPEHPANYYAEFDIVPPKYRSLLQIGKVLVTHWHGFAPESEHKDGDRNYPVVNKGPETRDVFVRRVLGKDTSERLPILVLNDEGHHCWRPKANTEHGASLTAEERQALKDEAEEARVWLDGLDRINNCGLAGAGKPGIALVVDLSATPFYIKGSNHPEGQPEGRTPNISAFGSASGKTCNRVSSCPGAPESRSTKQSGVKPRMPCADGGAVVAALRVGPSS